MFRLLGVFFIIYEVLGISKALWKKKTLSFFGVLTGVKVGG
jgi:hypothetical protein